MGMQWIEEGQKHSLGHASNGNALNASSAGRWWTPGGTRYKQMRQTGNYSASTFADSSPAGSASPISVNSPPSKPDVTSTCIWVLKDHLANGSWKAFHMPMLERDLGKALSPPPHEQGIEIKCMLWCSKGTPPGTSSIALPAYHDPSSSCLCIPCSTLSLIIMPCIPCSTLLLIVMRCIPCSTL
jgi:hypothetical protein